MSAQCAPDEELPTVQEAKALVPELCAGFYRLGWVSGTGGGVSLRARGGRLVMAPSGVQKERMTAADMFVLDASSGAVVEQPVSDATALRPAKLSECSPLFQAAYELRGAGAVLHSHALEVLLATLLDESSPVFTVTHMEMSKGLPGGAYATPTVVPVIENTARECELTASLRAAILAHPAACAVMVRRHGIYVWGRTWAAAKCQAECLHYLCSAAVEARKLGLRSLALPPDRADA